MSAEHPDRGVPSGAPQAESAYQAAVALHRRGEAQQADVYCADALQADPRHFNAYHLRGLIALGQGDMDRGIELIQRSLVINPDQPMAHSNLGNARLSLHQTHEALGCFEQALRLQPDLFVAWYNRANALRELHHLDQALESYEAALALNGAHVQAHCNRGMVLAELGRPLEALAAFDRAGLLDPNYPLAHLNRATLLLAQGRAPEALQSCERLVQLLPADPQAACMHGNVLLSLERMDEAIACYSHALRLNPAYADALINRSSALQRMRRLHDALADCEAALRLVPGSLLALRNAGNVLLGLDLAEDALALFDQALRQAPQDPEALNGCGAALGNMFHQRMACCDWRDYSALSARLHSSLTDTHRFTNPLSLMLFDDNALNLACAREFVARDYPFNPVLGPSPQQARASLNGKIRVAYVSADFCEHPVSHLLVGVLEHHDRERFEVTGLSLRAPGGGRFERRVRAAFDRCLNVHDRSDREVAAMMREWGIDIGIDLMGFTDGLRLGIFAHRAAPVQAGFVGYAGTVGAPYIDYLLADNVVIPSGEERWYSERIIKLPDCFLPNDDQREIGETPTRLDAGLPERGFVFCAFTKPHKINPPMFDIWMRLLHEVEGSVLWLRDMGNAAQSNLLGEAQARGVAPGRLVFAPRAASMAEHLGRQALADLYLDTLPYNAHSTTCDALWAGVPVLTCAGHSFGARVAASALRAVGLPELITQTRDEYASRARELALHPAILNGLRARLGSLRAQAPLFDTGRYTRNLEAAYRRMHESAH